MQCNIDARGRVWRLVMGLVLLAIAVALLVRWALPAGQMIAWLTTIAAFLAGAFCVYEGWAGWCAIRAMGLRTRL